MIQYRANGITVFQSALYQTTSTVIETPSSILVVDPTWLPHEVEAIQTYVSRVRSNRKLVLMFTHSDWDHIIGYKAFPDAVTIGSKELVENPGTHEVLGQIYSFDNKNYIERHYDIAYPAIDVVVHEDGQQYRLGETTLTFYKAPGHTDCGIFTVIEPLGVFLAGDYLSDVEFPLISVSSTAYEDTMHKVDAILSHHDVRILIPGHGCYTTDKQEMVLRKQQSLDYIAALRTYIQRDEQGQIEDMIASYKFARGMKAFHAENQALIRKELGLE